MDITLPVIPDCVPERDCNPMFQYWNCCRPWQVFERPESTWPLPGHHPTLSGGKRMRGLGEPVAMLEGLRQAPQPSVEEVAQQSAVAASEGALTALICSINPNNPACLGEAKRDWTPYIIVGGVTLLAIGAMVLVMRATQPVYLR